MREDAPHRPRLGHEPWTWRSDSGRRSPIRYALFSHYHPHYGATVVTTAGNEAFVRAIAAYPFTTAVCSPDAVQTASPPVGHSGSSVPFARTRLCGQNEQAFRVDRFALSRLEWRWFLSEGGDLFLFWDHALMSTRLALAAGGDRMEILHRDGIGFGLRLDAGGTVGIDYGLEPGRAPWMGRFICAW